MYLQNVVKVQNKIMCLHFHYILLTYWTYWKVEPSSIAEILCSYYKINSCVITFHVCKIFQKKTIRNNIIETSNR